MPLRASILKVLAYFDLFDYPVLAEEILYFLDIETEKPELNAELAVLTAENACSGRVIFIRCRTIPSSRSGGSGATGGPMNYCLSRPGSRVSSTSSLMSVG